MRQVKNSENVVKEREMMGYNGQNDWRPAQPNIEKQVFAVVVKVADGLSRARSVKRWRELIQLGESCFSEMWHA
jgi:hypothetical protein